MRVLLVEDGETNGDAIATRIVASRSGMPVHMLTVSTLRKRLGEPWLIATVAGAAKGA